MPYLDQEGLKEYTELLNNKFLKKTLNQYCVEFEARDGSSSATTIYYKVCSIPVFASCTVVDLQFTSSYQTNSKTACGTLVIYADNSASAPVCAVYGDSTGLVTDALRVKAESTGEQDSGKSKYRVVVYAKFLNYSQGVIRIQAANTDYPESSLMEKATKAEFDTALPVSNSLYSELFNSSFKQAGTELKVLVTDDTGKIKPSEITTEQLGQILNKLDKYQGASKKDRVLITDSQGYITTTSGVTSQELGNLVGSTGSIQNQLDEKLDKTKYQYVKEIKVQQANPAYYLIGSFKVWHSNISVELCSAANNDGDVYGTLVVATQYGNVTSATIYDDAKGHIKTKSQGEIRYPAFVYKITDTSHKDDSSPYVILEIYAVFPASSRAIVKANFIDLYSYLEGPRTETICTLADPQAFPSGHIYPVNALTEAINDAVTNGVKTEYNANTVLITDKNSKATSSGITTSELNTLSGIGTESIKTQLSGKAATNHASASTTYGVASESNYGHAKASSTSPKANGTATAGSETDSFARGDHVHPLQTSVSGSAGKVANNLTLQFNGTTKGTFDGSSGQTFNITPDAIGAAKSSHTHKYAESSSAGGNATTANKVANSLTLQFNGTTQATFNGSSAPIVNITPSAIGAAATSHTHNVSDIGIQISKPRISSISANTSKKSEFEVSNSKTPKAILVSIDSIKETDLLPERLGSYIMYVSAGAYWDASTKKVVAYVSNNTNKTIDVTLSCLIVLNN